jgi:hypothetical protein
VQEHADLIAAIRENNPINEAQQVADSTLTGILGRESAYTGQEVTWDEIRNAQMDLVPKEFAFSELPNVPVPRPGTTTLNRNFLADVG